MDTFLPSRKVVYQRTWWIIMSFLEECPVKWMKRTSFANRYQHQVPFSSEVMTIIIPIVQVIWMQNYFNCSFQWFSKCGPWTSNISIPWELAGNADSPAAPKTCWMGGWGWDQKSALSRSSGDSAECSSQRTIILWLLFMFLIYSSSCCQNSRLQIHSCQMFHPTNNSWGSTLYFLCHGI